MCEAGILGSLEFHEANHGWALEGGRQATRIYLALASQSSNLDQALLDDAVHSLEANLRAGRFQVLLPEVELSQGVGQAIVIADVVSAAMHVRDMKVMFAIWMIGMAHRFLEADRENAHFRELAMGLLARIDAHYPTLNVKYRALYEELLKISDEFLSIRPLLRNLRQSMIVLSVTADPRNTARLRLGDEQSALDRALRCRPSDLGQALRRFKPTIVHFSGHGSENGLCFQDDEGYEQTVEMSRLADLFRLAVGQGLKGVVINAFGSAGQAQTIADAVGYVVAMEAMVSDKGAVEFTAAFYGALGDGTTFEAAFKWALAETGLNAGIGPLTPRLLVRA